MAREKTVEVRAKVAHTQPGTQIYRAAGEVFTHTGAIYKHVEAATKAELAKAEDAVGDELGEAFESR